MSWSDIAWLWHSIFGSKLWGPLSGAVSGGAASLVVALVVDRHRDRRLLTRQYSEAARQVAPQLHAWLLVLIENIAQDILSRDSRGEAGRELDGISTPPIDTAVIAKLRPEYAKEIHTLTNKIKSVESHIRFEIDMNWAEDVNEIARTGTVKVYALGFKIYRLLEKEAGWPTDGDLERQAASMRELAQSEAGQ